MSDVRYIDKDFVKFKYKDEAGKARQATLVFGDKVDVLEEQATKTKIRALDYWDGEREGFVSGEPFRSRDKGVLKFSMVDVQQGDGMIIETPPDENDQTKIVFIDGGDNKLFARHAAARFFHRKSSKDNPLDVDLILITHGDADHFDGLNDIKRSETESHLAARKRLFIHPKRIYHNGLVKGPGGVAEDDRLGRTVPFKNDLAIMALFDDPNDAPAGMRNAPFTRWLKTVAHWVKRGPISLRRVAFGMNSQTLFGFLGDDIRVEIQGPFTVKAKDPVDGKHKPALPFLHRPPKSSVLHLEDGDPPGKSRSVSHTINGHSIALRLVYGNVRFSLSGDLNQESMHLMEQKLDLNELEAEIVKAPHHGAADFDFSALEKMRPVVSLISSGDESGGKEHIHPRATLVSALGRVSRGKTGIVLCTELAAFFAKRDYSHERSGISNFLRTKKPEQLAALKQFLDVDANGRVDVEELRTFFNKKRRSFEEQEALDSFFGFERTNFGIVHIRTDGERVLVFTHSGKKGMREAYRFNVDAAHKIKFAKDVESA